MSDVRKIRQLTDRVVALMKSFNAGTVVNVLFNELVDIGTRQLHMTPESLRQLVAGSLAKKIPEIGLQGRGWPHNDPMTQEEYETAERMFHSIAAGQSVHIIFGALLNAILYLFMRGGKLEQMLRTLDNAIEIQRQMEADGYFTKPEDLNGLPAWAR
jgi:hypothetical protein